MSKNIKKILLVVIGIIAIILSIRCYTIKECDSAEKTIYGGDAYTGIQNAAATTSENIKELAEIVKFGFGSILLISGLTLLAIGITTPIQKDNTEDSNFSYNNIVKPEKQTILSEKGNEEE
jgi:hypothetical protein